MLEYVRNASGKKQQMLDFLQSYSVDQKNNTCKNECPIHPTKQTAKQRIDDWENEENQGEKEIQIRYFYSARLKRSNKGIIRRKVIEVRNMWCGLVYKRVFIFRSNSWEIRDQRYSV